MWKEKYFKNTFLMIFLAELFSLFAFFLSPFNTAAFFVIFILVFILSLYKLEIGLFAVFVELMIGSKGYLFSFQTEAFTVSIRIALWSALMSAWACRLTYDTIKDNKFDWRRILPANWKFYLALLFFVACGAVRGLTQNNDFSSLFFDINGWIYFAMIFPAAYVFNRENKNDAVFLSGITGRFISAALAALAWLSVKTFALLYIFSHTLPLLAEPVYRWVRSSGVGEITVMPEGFSRIFFQSHIFALAGFLILLSYLSLARSAKTETGKYFFHWRIWMRNNWIAVLFLAVLMAVNFISFSRSNWVGLAAGTFALGLVLLITKKFKVFANAVILTVFSAIIGIMIIVAIAKFPLPQTSAEFNTAALFADRAGTVQNEAGASSRWSLLPPLWKEIKRNFLLGSGFGATVTYFSQDPRILENNPTGEYTTYAFEWGFLDIWLKLGIFGLLAYLALIMKIIISRFKSFNSSLDWQNSFVFLGLIASLFALAAVNIFSPYLNHPLGIGIVILSGILYNRNPIKPTV